jgi:hypothetical protein
MASNRNLQRQSQAQLTAVFTQTTEVILKGIGSRAFRPRRTVNAAMIDALMTGVATRLAAGSITDVSGLGAAYDSLLKSERFLGAIETGTSQEANVEARLALAAETVGAVV